MVTCLLSFIRKQVSFSPKGLYLPLHKFFPENLSPMFVPTEMEHIPGWLMTSLKQRRYDRPEKKNHPFMDRRLCYEIARSKELKMEFFFELFYLYPGK